MGKGIGPLDFLDDEVAEASTWSLSEETIEKWWCLGDSRNRMSMWIQGREVVHTEGNK